MRTILATICAALLMGGSAFGAAAASAKIIGVDGKQIGHARLMSVSHGVLIELEVSGLAPGAHAISVHASGVCDPAAQFASAGPIFSFETNRPHGYLVKGGPRAGDLPNQFAGSDGALHASIVVSAFTIGNGVKSILDTDGAALVVNANSDDYLTQPDGKAGARVACGVIKRSEPRKAHR